MIYYLITYYALFCIGFAYLNARWILNDKKIKHGLNGAIHLILAIGIAYLTKWYHFFTVVLMARVLFDWSLNLFRHLSLSYVPLNPKSIMDKIEKKLFGNDGITPKLVYILLIIILLTVL